MALGTPVAGAAAYSALNGTTITPALPAGVLATDVLLCVIGMKPSTANSGGVNGFTHPVVGELGASQGTGFTLLESLTGAGGYGTTLGADSGNTNLWIYHLVGLGGQTGNVTVSVNTNNIAWAFLVRIPTGGGTISFGSADGQRTTTPTSPMTVALTNGATATNFQAGDLALWAMCIPTDVTTPAQFSAHSVTATSATFATAVELNEPDNSTGNDIGGFSTYASVSSGSSTAAPSITATLAGTLTNVRGPVGMVRVRETVVAITHNTSGALTGQLGNVAGTAHHNVPHATSGALPGQTATITGAADRQTGIVTHATTGALTGTGSAIAGSAARLRQFATSGTLTSQGPTLTGTSARIRQQITTGTLTAQGSTVAGASTRTRAHPTSGVLSGQGAEVAGSAVHNIQHTTSGTLTGSGTTVAGATDRTRVHPSSGDLTGQASTLSGAAARTLLHATEGVLATNSAMIDGSALRMSPYSGTIHNTDGTLVGGNAQIAGTANHISLYPDPANVLAGVIYGPSGSYTGTMSGNGDLPYVMKVWNGSAWQILYKDPVVY